MNLASIRLAARIGSRTALMGIVLAACIGPAAAQNKKHAWEVFLYFGSFYKNDVPSASQYANITTYRTDPEIPGVNSADPNAVFTPDLGKVGGDVPPDPNYAFFTGPGTQFQMAPCNNQGPPYPDPNTPDPRYRDECDNDQETRYIYNAGHITTNGAIQKDDSEFTLGIRGGYNFTRHWEVEFDVGFGKQRLDLTKNLNPLLQASINDISDPRAADLAKFYNFTWASSDYETIVLNSDEVNTLGPGEHPNVIASRHASDPTYNIPIYFPLRPDSPSSLVPAGETFADVTAFVNRVFLDPTAFRNRGNQINIDTFTVSATANYNFNTKADSRIIPYLAAGVGKWFRNFDQPWSGDNSPVLTYGAGVRFFVNEIFSFRADARLVHFMDKSFTINGALHNFNLQDHAFSGFGATTCERDNRDRRPPCTPANIAASDFFPNLHGGGGNADVSVEAEQADFYEVRLGFDVVLGGK